MYRDPLLATFVRVCSDGRAKTLTVSPAVAVASVGQAVPIKPGHINLKGTQHVYTVTNREIQMQSEIEAGKSSPTEAACVYRVSHIQLFTREELMRYQDKGMWVNWCRK